MSEEIIFYTFKANRLAQVDDVARFVVQASACRHKGNGAFIAVPERSRRFEFQILGSFTEAEVREEIAHCGSKLGIHLALEGAIQDGLIAAPPEKVPS
jgi:hypothetical protein